MGYTYSSLTVILPLGSLGAVSYSPAKVGITMAVSLTVYKIFSVKE